MLEYFRPKSMFLSFAIISTLRHTHSGIAMAAYAPLFKGAPCSFHQNKILNHVNNNEKDEVQIKSKFQSFKQPNKVNHTYNPNPINIFTDTLR